MISTFDTTILGILIFLSIFLLILLNYVLNRSKRKQLDKIFALVLSLILFWIISAALQIVFVNKYNIDPIYFDYFAYISACFLPVAFLFLSLTFTRTKIKFKKRYYLVFIIPILSLILLWTNNYHHLFYNND